MDRLVKQAAALFRRKGYHGTTTRELSDALGIRNATLYYHVENKEEILWRICLAVLDEVQQAFDEILKRPQTPLERLESLMSRYVVLVLSNRDAHTAFLTEIRALTEQHRTHVVSLRDEIVAVVREAIKDAQEGRKVRTDIDSKYLALGMFNLVNWSIFWFNPNEELTVEQMASLFWQIYWSGVTGK